MARTNRDKLVAHPEWIGKVPKVWTARAFRKKARIPREYRSSIVGMWCACCSPPRGSRKEIFRSAKRKAERFWRKEI